MGVYSNTGSSVFWTNPDSNFGINNFGYYNTPIGIRQNNNIPVPLSTTYSNSGVVFGFGGLGLGLIGMSPFLGYPFPLMGY